MFKNALRKVFANGSVRLGGGVLLLLILMSIFAPWLGTIDPTMLDPGSQNLLPGTTNVFMTLDGDEFEHFFLMGSDSLGRDIWSRTLYGGRVSITLGISVALLAVFFGTVAGLLSGYFRWVDAVMMRVMDGFMSIPPSFRNQFDCYVRQRFGHRGDRHRYSEYSAHCPTGALRCAVGARGTLR